MRCQILRSKACYIVFQHQLLFNLVKDFFKRIDGLGRSVIVRVQSEGEKVFDLDGIRKKYLIRCQISRSKTRYAMFQHQLLFNLVKDLFKRIDELGRSVAVRGKSESEKNFWTEVVYEKSIWYVVKFRAQKLAIVFQHKLFFNLVKDLFNWFIGLGRSVTVKVQFERERVFDLGGIRKNIWYVVRFRTQKLAI